MDILMKLTSRIDAGKKMLGALLIVSFIFTVTALFKYPNNMAVYILVGWLFFLTLFSLFKLTIYDRGLKVIKTLRENSPNITKVQQSYIRSGSRYGSKTTLIFTFFGGKNFGLVVPFGYMRELIKFLQEKNVNLGSSLDKFKDLKESV